MGLRGTRAGFLHFQSGRTLCLQRNCTRERAGLSFGSEAVLRLSPWLSRCVHPSLRVSHTQEELAVGGRAVFVPAAKARPGGGLVRALSVTGSCCAGRCLFGNAKVPAEISHFLHPHPGGN